jgi:hypothetical protein
LIPCGVRKSIDHYGKRSGEILNLFARGNINMYIHLTPK